MKEIARRSRHGLPSSSSTPTTSFPGPFRTRVSQQAEQLQFDLLSDEEKAVLAHAVPFDPRRYEVYRFFVVLESLLEAPQLSVFANWSRRLKRQSLAKASRVLIRLRPISKAVTFIGIHPTTRDRDGQTAFDLSGEVLFGVTVPGVLRLRVSGKAKDLLRRRKAEIIAARTDSSAEWIFLRPFIETNNEIRLQFCCLVPNDLAASARVMRCEVAVEDGNRLLDSQRKKLRFARI